MFHSFHQQVNIVLTKDGICTLINVVITNAIGVDLLHQSCATRRFVPFEIVQAKERSYHDRHPIYHFLPFTIEVFGCLNKKIDMFLHNCTKPCGTSKGQKALLFLFWLLFSIKKSQLHYKGFKHPPSEVG